MLLGSECVAEGLGETREGAAAALLGRCDKYGMERWSATPVRWYWLDSVIGSFSLISKKSSSSVSVCTRHKHPQMAWPNPAFQQRAPPASSLANQKPRQPSGSLPQIQGLGPPAYSWDLALSTIHIKGGSQWGRFSPYEAAFFFFLIVGIFLVVLLMGTGEPLTFRGQEPGILNVLQCTGESIPTDSCIGEKPIHNSLKLEPNSVLDINTKPLSLNFQKCNYV